MTGRLATLSHYVFTPRARRHLRRVRSNLDIRSHASSSMPLVGLADVHLLVTAPCGAAGF